MNPRDEWAGDFGQEYLDRNRVNWRARTPFWANALLGRMGAWPRSIHEVGCNAGWNLSAIQRIDHDINLTGHDINEEAIQQAQEAGLNVWMEGAASNSRNADLVFTAGVLIHIPPAELHAMMQSIIDRSYRYVLAIEYDHPVEQEIEYRGKTGLLWKRPYGKMYASMGLKLLDVWDAGPGFDRCTAYLLSKD